MLHFVLELIRIGASYEEINHPIRVDVSVPEGAHLGNMGANIIARASLGCVELFKGFFNNKKLIKVLGVLALVGFATGLTNKVVNALEHNPDHPEINPLQFDNCNTDNGMVNISSNSSGQYNVTVYDGFYVNRTRLVELLGVKNYAGGDIVVGSGWSGQRVDDSFEYTDNLNDTPFTINVTGPDGVITTNTLSIPNSEACKMISDSVQSNLEATNPSQITPVLPTNTPVPTETSTQVSQLNLALSATPQPSSPQKEQGTGNSNKDTDLTIFFTTVGSLAGFFGLKYLFNRITTKETKPKVKKIITAPLIKPSLNYSIGLVESYFHDNGLSDTADTFNEGRVTIINRLGSIYLGAPNIVQELGMERAIGEIKPIIVEELSKADHEKGNSHAGLIASHLAVLNDQIHLGTSDINFMREVRAANDNGEPPPHYADTPDKIVITSQPKDSKKIGGEWH